MFVLFVWFIHESKATEDKTAEQMFILPEQYIYMKTILPGSATVSNQTLFDICWARGDFLGRVCRAEKYDDLL